MTERTDMVALSLAGLAVTAYGFTLGIVGTASCETSDGAAPGILFLVSLAAAAAAAGTFATRPFARIAAALAVAAAWFFVGGFVAVVVSFEHCPLDITF